MIRRLLGAVPGLAALAAAGVFAWSAMPFRFGARSAPAALETIVDSSTPAFSGTWTFELHPTAGGTRVRITERGSISSPPLRRYLADLEASFASHE